MNPEIEQLKRQVQRLESILGQFLLPDRYRFPRSIEVIPSFDLIHGQGGKLGFYGVAPVVQPAGASGNTTGHFAGGGTTLTLSDNFSGKDHTGGMKYTIPEIVGALKDLGLLSD